MAKANIVVNNRDIEVEFTLDEQENIAQVLRAQYIQRFTENIRGKVRCVTRRRVVDLTRDEMRRNVIEALEQLLDNNYEDVEFEDGEDLRKIAINPDTGIAQFYDDYEKVQTFKPERP